MSDRRANDRPSGTIAAPKRVCYKVRTSDIPEDFVRRSTASVSSLSLRVGLGLTLAAFYGCAGKGDIQPGIGAAGVRLGANRAAVEKILGKPDQVSSTGVRGSKRRETTYLIYPAKGIDVLLEGGGARSIFLYREGADDHRGYAGRTADGLTVSSNRDEVLAVLREPDARGLGEDVHRWFRYDSGIEFTFEENGAIHHIVITLPR